MCLRRPLLLAIMPVSHLEGHRSPPAWPGEDASQDRNWADEWLQEPVVAMLNEAAGKSPADKNAEVRPSPAGFLVTTAQPPSKQ